MTDKLEQNKQTVTAFYDVMFKHPTPGHTPGHSCYVVASKGESIEFWG